MHAYLLLLPLLFAADPDDDARAALALAEAAKSVTPVTPAEPPEGPIDQFFLSFADAKAKAFKDNLPLIVFIGCDVFAVEGAVTCAGGKTPGYPAKCVVVSERGGQYWSATLPPYATTSEIRRAAGLEAGAKPAPFDRKLDPRSIPRKVALPEVRDAGEPEFRAWDANESYQFGERVLHNGTLWMARKDHSGQEPGRAPFAHWLNVNFER